MSYNYEVARAELSTYRATLAAVAGLGHKRLRHIMRGANDEAALAKALDAALLDAAVRGMTVLREGEKL